MTLHKQCRCCCDIALLGYCIRGCTVYDDNASVTLFVAQGNLLKKEVACALLAAIHCSSLVGGRRCAQNLRNLLALLDEFILV